MEADCAIIPSGSPSFSASACLPLIYPASSPGMPPQPAAQSLPQNIIARIIEYAASKRGILQTTDVLQVHFTPNKALTPFMSVSKEWRAVARRVYFKMAMLIFSGAPGAAIPCSLSVRGVLELARHVEIEVPLRLIACGSLPSLVEKQPFANAEFPLVTRLTLHYTGGAVPTAGQAHELLERFRHFSARMLGLFPNTSTVICQDTVSTDRISAGLTRLTIAEFLRNVSALVFVSGDYRHDPARDAWPTGLTNIRLQSGYYSHSFPELVRRNAPTLADLYIYSPNQSTYRHVVQCPDGTTVIYPNLRRLRTLALGYRGPYDAASLPAPQGAPFPALRHLSIADQYPFSNDVLFRGNSTTLEYLALKLTPHLLDVIETYRLLAPGSYPQLHYLSLGKMFRMRSMTEQQAQMLIRMPFELGPNIQVIKTHMFNYPLDSRMLECVWRSKFHSDIRYLNVHSIPLFLTDTVRLVRFLPRLTRLLCRFKGYSAEKTRHIHADDVKRLHAHHFPIRSHLQYFEAGRNPHRSLRLQGELCFMLAILVPSIHHLGCGKHTGSSTSDAIELACKQPAFQEHAGRLDTLRLF